MSTKKLQIVQGLNFINYGISQDLTDEQKEQARINIGFSDADAISLVTELNLVSPVAADDGTIYTDENGAVYIL